MIELIGLVLGLIVAWLAIWACAAAVIGVIFVIQWFFTSYVGGCIIGTIIVFAAVMYMLAPYPQVVQGVLGALGFTFIVAFFAGLYGQLRPRLILNVSGGFTLLEAFALAYEHLTTPTTTVTMLVASAVLFAAARYVSQTNYVEA